MLSARSVGQKNGQAKRESPKDEWDDCTHSSRGEHQVFLSRNPTCIQHNTTEEFSPNLLKRPRLCDKDDMDRMATLSEILAQDPNNVLARYGLAMEYANSGKADRALEEFGKLLSTNPDYAAAYFMAAQTLVKANRSDEAKRMLVDGIAAAQRKRDSHAESEMQAMLDDLS